MVSTEIYNIAKTYPRTNDPRPRTLPPRVEALVVVPLVPRVTDPRPRALKVCCEEIPPLPLVDPTGTAVFLRIPRPRAPVGVFVAIRFAASSFAFSAASVAF